MKKENSLVLWEHPVQEKQHYSMSFPPLIKSVTARFKIEGKEMTGMKEKQLAEFRKNHLGFIFQEYNLLDTLTVKENILLPLSITKASKKEADQKFQDVQQNLAFMN